jgi:hypothetical protein
VNRRGPVIGRGFAVTLLAAFLALVTFAVVAIGASRDAVVRSLIGSDGHRRLYLDDELVRYDGAGPERWAARYRAMRRLAQARARRLDEQRRAVQAMRRRLDAGLERIPARLAIRLVFGPYAGEALAVANCETGGSYSTSATNGQYVGLFQMGSGERAAYGEGSTPLEQALAAYVYFVATGRDWSPWSCKP